jgi:hypothetical protein
LAAVLAGSDPWTPVSHTSPQPPPLRPLPNTNSPRNHREIKNRTSLLPPPLHDPQHNPAGEKSTHQFREARDRGNDKGLSSRSTQHRNRFSARSLPNKLLYRPYQQLLYGEGRRKGREKGRSSKPKETVVVASGLALEGQASAFAALA